MEYKEHRELRMGRRNGTEETVGTENDSSARTGMASERIGS